MKTFLEHSIAAWTWDALKRLFSHNLQSSSDEKFAQVFQDQAAMQEKSRECLMKSPLIESEGKDFLVWNRKLFSSHRRSQSGKKGK